MKKSLIVIALALLMLVPVFADVATASETSNGAAYVQATSANATPVTTAGSEQKTDVKITLNLFPKYYFAISTEKYTDMDITIDPSETSKRYYENLGGVDEIAMTNDETKLEVGSPKGTYYVSYWFRDYNQSCTLSVAIDQDLTLQTTGANGSTTNYTPADGETADQYTIKYFATLTPQEGGTGYEYGTTTSISSPGISGTNASSIIVARCAATKALGQVLCGDLKIVLSPYSLDKSTANKFAGNYLSHIVLTLKANA